MDARILIKHSASKCNKELLEFLHKNIRVIKSRFALKVIIVYDDLIPKLGAKIKRLPVLIINNSAVTGNSNIRDRLISSIGVTKVKDVAQDKGCDDLHDYWNSEMHSGKDEQLDASEDLMEGVKNRALEQSQQHREAQPKKKTSKPVVSSAREDNIQLETMQGDKISDLVDNDPIMKKFWDNQESTPGF